MIFWLHVKKRTKRHFFLCSARSPHRTAKFSRGCLPLAHPRALPAVMVSDRRSPSAMFEFPFECLAWGVAAVWDRPPQAYAKSSCARPGAPLVAWALRHYATRSPASYSRWYVSGGLGAHLCGRGSWRQLHGRFMAPSPQQPWPPHRFRARRRAARLPVATVAAAAREAA